MRIEGDSTIPIYIQIAEAIEDMILESSIKEGEQVPSTNQLADYYKLNPATARKGLGILTDEKILFKKRGVGMFVSEGALTQIRSKRKRVFVEEYVISMLNECKKLNLSLDEVIKLIKETEENM